MKSLITHRHSHTHSDRHIFFVNKKKQNQNKTLLQKQKQQQKERKKERKRNKKYMFVCMFYLSPRSRIIVSVWETSELKKNKMRKNRERRRSKCWVSSLQTLRKFCYFFCFIFYEQLRNEPFKRAPFCIFTFVSFSFSFFSCFWYKQTSLAPSRLATAATCVTLFSIVF